MELSNNQYIIHTKGTLESPDSLSDVESEAGSLSPYSTLMKRRAESSLKNAGKVADYQN
jgi:hypothetical protein